MGLAVPAYLALPAPYVIKVIATDGIMRERDVGGGGGGGCCS